MHELKAGLVANDIYVALLDAVNDPSSPTFDQDTRDICSAATINLAIKQSIVVRWHRASLSTAPVANVQNHLAQTAVAMIARNRVVSG